SLGGAGPDGEGERSLAAADTTTRNNPSIPNPSTRVTTRSWTVMAEIRSAPIGRRTTPDPGDGPPAGPSRTVTPRPSPAKRATRPNAMPAATAVWPPAAATSTATAAATSAP